MRRYVIDTHPFFFYLFEPKKLGMRARRACQQAEEGAARLLLPAIVAAECYWVAAARGHGGEVLARLEAIASGTSEFQPVDFRVGDTLRFADLEAVPEMHDRMVVAAAVEHGCPVITKDQAITGSGLVATLW